MTFENISPWLVAVLDDYQEGGAPAVTMRARALGVVPRRVALPEPHSMVFVHCEKDTDLTALSVEGIEVNDGSGGEVRTAIVPLDKMHHLASAPGVRFVGPSRPARLSMDVARGVCGVPAFRSRTGASGKGVLIGIIDTGIDSGHAAFGGRIRCIWDQTLPGPGVPGAGYGVELLGPALSTSQDTNGHGTHVAAIAAGNDPVYTGVAPGAELVIVKTDMQTAHIADGIRYVTRIAHQAGLPCVINLSLGEHGDAHDGTDSLSAVIDSASGPGRIVCCAAGNEGNDDIHAQLTIPPGKEARLRFRVPAGVVPGLTINGWYGGAAGLEVAVRSPRGFTTPFQPVITGASPSMAYVFPDARLRVITPGPDPRNGDHNFLLVVRGAGPGAVVAGGTWQVLLRNSSGAAITVDAWSIDDDGGTQVIFVGPGVQDRMKIGSPGSAAEAITVASHTSKVTWTAMGPPPSPHSVGLALHDISDFSSEGPLRNNGQKPDFAAPGAMIASALSRYRAGSFASYIVDPAHLVEAGTSMATPFVTGLVALLLERPAAVGLPASPRPAEIKAYLKTVSTYPGAAPGVHHEKWGWGLLRL